MSDMYLNDSEINRRNLASVRQRSVHSQRQRTSSHNSPCSKMYKCNGKSSLHPYYNRKISDSCSNVPNLVTIDPLESTDSMVCAFASVANVVSDDGMSDYVSMDEDSTHSTKTNHYIIEVRPNAAASYSSEQSTNTDDIESESHFYETIYPSKQKCNNELRTVEMQRLGDTKLARNQNQHMNNNKNNNDNYSNDCDDEEKVSSSNSDEKSAPTLPVVASKRNNNNNNSSNCCNKNKNKNNKNFVVGGNNNKCQLVEVKCKSILKENVKMKLIEAHYDPRRKNDDDVSSSIASSSQTVRLQPDEVYPGYVAGSLRGSDQSRDYNGSNNGEEVNYAVIMKDCNQSVDCEMENVTDNNANTATVCTNKAIRQCAVDIGDLPVNGKCELIFNGNRNINNNSNNHCDEKKQPSKSFFRKFNGFKKAISRAFSAEKISKSKQKMDNNNGNGPPLESSRSVPVLTINAQQQPHQRTQYHISADNLPSLSLEPEIEAKNSFVKSLKNRMSLRRKPAKIKVKVDIEKSEKSGSNSNLNKANNEKKVKWKRNVNESRGCSLSPDPKTEHGVWGELKQLYSNGSQLIELHRVAGKHFGFFVARGTVNNVKGVFVSRMRDEETQKSLTGLLEIGDEIIAIDGVNVKNSNILQVNQLMAHKTRIVLHVIPYVNHKYR